MGAEQKTAARLLQQQVAAFTKTHRLDVRPQDRLLDLNSEVGELCKAWLAATRYGSAPFQNDQEFWREELGDVFFSLICLANATDVDLQQALQQVLDKYSRRLARNGSASSTPVRKI